MKRHLIHFVKETSAKRKETQSSASQAADSDRAAEFYEKLVLSKFCSSVEPRRYSERVNACKQRKPAARRDAASLLASNESVSKANKGKCDINKLFQCAEQNDTRGIQECLDSGISVDSQDMHGWSALMVSVCQRQRDAVLFLLDKGASPDLKNKKGNSARDIALQKHFSEFARLVEQTAHPSTSTEQTSRNRTRSLHSHPDDFSGFCEECNIETAEMRRHCSSLGHLLTKPHDPPKVASFAISSKNVGYRLMLRQGWSGDTGLGADESGRLYPVKTTMKKDRLGIGLSGKNVLKLPESETKFVPVHELRKRRKREQQLERRIRQDFNE